MTGLFEPVEMAGGYFDISLVMLSYGVAVLASYSALSIGKRYSELQGKSALYWLLVGSFSMGLGIWSMHFVGMLAFSMSMPFSYDIPFTLASLLVGMLSATGAIHIGTMRELGPVRLLIGGSILGCGIAGMHYTGMAGMVMPATLSYNPAIFALSIAIAVGASIAALWIISRFNLRAENAVLLKIAAALVMGLAICGMHYTGMAAAIYTPIPGVVHSFHEQGVSDTGLALTVSAATVAVILTSLLTAYFDRKLDVEKDVASQLTQIVKERTEDLELQARSLARANKKLANEIQERREAQEESDRLSYILDESSTEIYYFEESSLKFLGANKGAQRNIQYNAVQLKSMTLFDLMVDCDLHDFEEMVYSNDAKEKDTVIFETRFQRRDKSTYLAMVSLHRSYAAVPAVFVAIVEDITERKRLEERLSASRKLESIGQLAAGVAHEINTPIQFVGENVALVEKLFGDMLGVIKSHAEAIELIRSSNLFVEELAELENAFSKLDIDYLSAAVPRALTGAIECIDRVGDITRAMKEFSHPGTLHEKSPVQLNAVLETAITVSANEWKYVAEVERELDPDLPLVQCSKGELNQVFLNLIVNAAHAIEDAKGDDQGLKGRITVSSCEQDDWIEVRIRDTGRGIPDGVAEHVFEPFFTTKSVGKGTGQGLAIAHNIVVVNHQGELFFETDPYMGTTFIIRLPRQQREPSRGEWNEAVHDAHCPETC